MAQTTGPDGGGGGGKYKKVRHFEDGSSVRRTKSGLKVVRNVDDRAQGKGAVRPTQKMESKPYKMRAIEPLRAKSAKMKARKVKMTTQRFVRPKGK